MVSSPKQLLDLVLATAAPASQAQTSAGSDPLPTLIATIALVAVAATTVFVVVRRVRSNHR